MPETKPYNELAAQVETLSGQLTDMGTCVSELSEKLDALAERMADEFGDERNVMGMSCGQCKLVHFYEGEPPDRCPRCGNKPMERVAPLARGDDDEAELP